MRDKILLMTFVMFMIPIFLILPAYAEEQKQFHVTTNMDFPESLIPGETTNFEITVTYNGPYSWMKNLEPTFEIFPANARPYVTIQTHEDFSLFNFWKGHINTLYGTIHISKDIPFNAIFVSVSFNGDIRFEQQATSIDPDSGISLKIDDTLLVGTSGVSSLDIKNSEVWIESQRTTLSISPGTLEFNKIPDDFLCNVIPIIDYTIIQSDTPVVYPQHDSLVVRVGGENTVEDFEMMMALQDSENSYIFAEDLSYNISLTKKNNYDGIGGGLYSPDPYSDYSTLGLAVEANSSVQDGILYSEDSRILGMFPSNYVTPLGISSNGNYILDVKIFDSEGDWIDSDRCGIQAIIPISVNGTDDVKVGQLQFSNIKVSVIETDSNNLEFQRQIIKDVMEKEHLKFVMEWDDDDYLSSGTGILSVIASEMNVNSDRIDTFDISVWSNSDVGGINLTMIETDETTGIFQGEVTFTTHDESSGHRLRVIAGDTIIAKYNDVTTTSRIADLPSPFKQQNSGILPEDVICKNGFEKIFKLDKSKVICVLPLSVEKLIYRGWMI